MFEYNSVQTHSEFKNGKGQSKINRVTIKGKKGFKSITIRNKSGKVLKKSEKRLTRKEISCIRKCQFIPGLFKDCQECLK
jgi:hypothetical protein